MNIDAKCLTNLCNAVYISHFVCFFEKKENL